MKVAGVEVEHVARIEPRHLPDGRLSVVVYGPGHGESVLIRLPDGAFGVVDGCGESGDRRDGNPVLTLLEAIPGVEVRFAGLTHPHEDHVRGLHEIIQCFKPPRVWWAGVEHAKTFEPYLKLLREKRDKGARADRPPPVKAIEKTLHAIHEHVESGRAQGAALSDYKLLYQLRAVSPPLSVFGVLPTTASVRNAMAWLQRTAPAEGATPEHDLPPDVEAIDEGWSDINDVSGAFYITWGEARILLTGDALTGPRRGRQEGQRGWRWVLQQGLEPCVVVKVAHHASSGAHDPELWGALSPKIALVTPYQHARKPMPPRPEMLRTLLATGSNVGLTCPPDGDWWAGAGLRGRSFSAPIPVPDMPGGAPTALRRDVECAIAVILTADGTIEQVFTAGGAGFLSLDPTADPIVAPSP